MREVLLGLFFAVLGGYIVELLKECSDKMAYAWLRLLGKLVPTKINKLYVQPGLGETMDMEASKVAKLSHALQISWAVLCIMVQRERDMRQPVATALLVLPVVLYFVPHISVVILTTTLGLWFVSVVIWTMFTSPDLKDRSVAKSMLMPALLYGGHLLSAVLLNDSTGLVDFLRLLTAPGLLVVGLVARVWGLTPLRVVTLERKVRILKMQINAVKIQIKMKEEYLEAKTQKAT